VLPFLLAILRCISAQTLPPATTCEVKIHTILFISCDKSELTRWCLCSLYAGIQISPYEVVGCRDVCRHSIAESTVDVPIRLFRQIFSARKALFTRPLRNLRPTSDRHLIFASHLADRMVPAIAIISRLLCLQRMHGSFKYLPNDALLSFCRNMKFAVHVPYAG